MFLRFLLLFDTLMIGSPLPVLVGGGKASKGMNLRYWWGHPLEKSCSPAIFGGCGGSFSLRPGLRLGAFFFCAFLSERAFFFWTILSETIRIAKRGARCPQCGQRCRPLQFATAPLRSCPNFGLLPQFRNSCGT